MKNQILFIVLSAVAVAGFSACNEQPEPAEVVEEEALIQFANPSDRFFADALDNFENMNFSKAANMLEKGVEALKKEGKGLDPDDRTALDKQIAKISDLSVMLKSGKSINGYLLRSAIANAELNVSHTYLIEDDLYVLPVKEAMTENADSTALK